MKKQFFIFLLAGLTLSNPGSGATPKISDSLAQNLEASSLSPRAVTLISSALDKYSVRKDVAAIVDYTLPSSQPRFFLINLSAQSFKVVPVSHGVGTGDLMATVFSNTPNSNASSLGFLKTGNELFGNFGRSLQLIGLSPSDSKLASRGISLHSAEYSSPEYLARYGQWGRSFGCLAVPQEKIDEVIDLLGSGALILAYHDKLWDEAQQNPDRQALTGQPNISAPTRWEFDENTMGNHRAHRRGAPPTTLYKSKYVQSAGAVAAETGAKP